MQIDDDNWFEVRDDAKNVARSISNNLRFYV